MRARRRESLVFPIIVLIVAGLASLPMALIALMAGRGIVALAAALAFVPVLPLVMAYLWLDRYEPEPRILLAAGLAWGAFVSTLLAILVQGIGGFFAGLSVEASTVVIAPITEEATKGLFLLLLLWWRRAELDGILDGLVYAGMVGIGFAFTENILYLAAAYNGTDSAGPGGYGALGATFVVRCLASPFAHPVFTSFIGIGVGIAIGSRSGAVRFLAPILGYVAAVLAHAAWNGSATYLGSGFALVYLVVMLPVFFLLVGFAIWSRSRERLVLAQSLGDAAQRGLIDPRDVPQVVDLSARRRSRAFAKAQGGSRGLDAMREWQQAAVELGFLHYRALRGTAPANFIDLGQTLVERMQAVRPWIAFPPGGHVAQGGPR